MVTPGVSKQLPGRTTEKSAMTKADVGGTGCGSNGTGTAMHEGRLARVGGRPISIGTPVRDESAQGVLVSNVIPEVMMGVEVSGNDTGLTSWEELRIKELDPVVVWSGANGWQIKIVQVKVLTFDVDADSDPFSGIVLCTKWS